MPRSRLRNNNVTSNNGDNGNTDNNSDVTSLSGEAGMALLGALLGAGGGGGGIVVMVNRTMLVIVIMAIRWRMPMKNLVSNSS